MKKMVLFAVLVAFTVLQAAAFPVMKYSNKCFLGCGSVWWQTSIYSAPDGTSFIGAEVKCRGVGIQSCPSRNVGPDLIAIEDVELEPWEATPIDAVVNHAWDEMDLGHSSGSYYVNYTNISTGENYQYTITWLTTYLSDGSVDEISYTIDRIEL
ncbi:MAG: hypothetical protein ACYC1Q_10405 [Bacteroidia bacterium]